MKKINLVIILLIVALTSCGDDKLKKNQSTLMKKANVVTPTNVKENYDVIKIDGCEYVIYSEYQGYEGFGFMAHKGNCNNPIHKH